MSAGAGGGQRGGQGAGAGRGAGAGGGGAGPPGERLTIALAKGRLLGEAVALLRRAGLRVGDLADPGRRLLVELPPQRIGGDRPGDGSGRGGGGAADGEVALRALILKPDDVPTYVERGAADCGVCGTDVLREHPRELYEPLDLGIGRCRLVLAARAGAAPVVGTMRIATKFVALARGWAEARGLAAEIIPLAGSVELAPAAGLADRIVDLVQSGETLRANGLVELETLAEVTARLVVNRAALKLKRAAFDALLSALRAEVAR
ncbi:MAG TPA: ATP phosphoribosyltransferase [Myxococcota bacterium]|jgi:ATP phosphoribosyltransferase|nr:ATP phosphoribosyltransferase [Myxococcota bacterium]